MHHAAADVSIRAKSGKLCYWDRGKKIHAAQAGEPTRPGIGTVYCAVKFAVNVWAAPMVVPVAFRRLPVPTVR